jgi:PAS domain S-box-containing protein
MTLRAGRSTLEEFLGSILRGAAKLLGCSSTNLILINERAQEIRVLIGAMAVSYPLLEQIENVLGNSFDGITLPLGIARESMILESWRDHTTRETSSLHELIGGVFPFEAIERAAEVVGDQRFICVPAITGTRNYGVLLFTKEGRHPFSRQQRAVLLRYARRIGEIIENDPMGQGQSLVAHALPAGPKYLLFDASGELTGESDGPRGLTPRAFGELQEAVRGLSRSADQDGVRVQLSQEITAELSRFCWAPAATARAARGGPVASPPEPAPAPFCWAPAATARAARGGPVASPPEPAPAPCVLCALRRSGGQAGDTSLENQLLQLTLGDTTPALFLDPEFRITSANPATEQVLGYGPSDLLHQPIGILFREPREILDILGQQILYPENPYCAESAVVVCRDGTLTPSRVEALMLADDRHQVVGFLVLVRAADANEDVMVQERLATMGEMATQLAHEIRNPLVAIGATLESLGNEDNLTDGQHEVLATLSREITRMDMILRDYLAARHDVALSEVSVGELAQDARRLLAGARKAAGKRITVSVPPELSIVADYDAIRHVFFNLLLNALEASPDGGEVSCSATAGDHDVSIYIDDSGPGLVAGPEDCFQPFFTTKKNGTGLGLAVCQKVARAHGGLVELKNRDDGGCRATLVLPRRRTAVNSNGMAQAS